MREHLLLPRASPFPCSSLYLGVQLGWHRDNIPTCSKQNKSQQLPPCRAPSAQISWHRQDLNISDPDHFGCWWRFQFRSSEGFWNGKILHGPTFPLSHQGGAQGGIQSSDAFFLMAAKELLLLLLLFNSRQISWKIQSPTGGNSCGSSCWGRSPAGH